ncbi:hypothetical protein PZ897_01925 [Hoeflea sp. YIM 152468]|uniref:hypothetical protein n=1 Tax=Hoeflea sp. YIM 152468 TaxID=3031759 RepID=UPI0023DCA4D9|nr:hypothetical protein [Hoeflea sp. YIM 152468]MDF1606928.1 hypothetical protein [Hoeflea sp. YIM 152468]
MNEKPLDPVSARQARQGKPVLAILLISLVLALIGGWVLWGVMVEDAGPVDTNSSQIEDAPANAAPQS